MAANPSTDGDDLPGPLSDWDTNFNEEMFNTSLKLIIENALAPIPVAGGLLGSIVELLWPTVQEPDQTWANIRFKVESAIHVAMDAERAQHFKSGIDALQKSLKWYTKYEDYSNPDKVARLEAIIATSQEYESDFFDTRPRAWKKIMPFFVSLGTLRLSLLYERYMFWDQLNNKPPSKTPSHDRLVARAELHETIIKYLSPLYRIVNSAVKWRGRKITLTKTRKSLAFGEWEFVVTDELNKEAYRRWYGAIPGPGTDAEAAAEKHYRDLVEAEEAKFREKLDNYLEPAKSWLAFAHGEKLGCVFPHYIPSAPCGAGNRRQWVEVGVEHQWFPVEMTTFDDEDKYFEHGPIAAIGLRAGSLVDGIEVYYGHKSAGFRGNKNGGTEQWLHVKREDSKGHSGMVTRVSGWADWCVDRIRFQSRPSGEWIEGGSLEDRKPFDAAIQLDTGDLAKYKFEAPPRVAWFKGKYSKDRLEQLEVMWMAKADRPKW